MVKTVKKDLLKEEAEIKEEKASAAMSEEDATTLCTSLIEAFQNSAEPGDAPWHCEIVDIEIENGVASVSATLCSGEMCNMTDFTCTLATKQVAVADD
jgi:hypothetical protein